VSALRSVFFFTVIVLIAIVLIPWVIFDGLRCVLNNPCEPDPDWLKHQ